MTFYKKLQHILGDSEHFISAGGYGGPLCKNNDFAFLDDNTNLEGVLINGMRKPPINNEIFVRIKIKITTKGPFYYYKMLRKYNGLKFLENDKISEHYYYDCNLNWTFYIKDINDEMRFFLLNFIDEYVNGEDNRKLDDNLEIKQTKDRIELAKNKYTKFREEYKKELEEELTKEDNIAKEKEEDKEEPKEKEFNVEELIREKKANIKKLKEEYRNLKNLHELILEEKEIKEKIKREKSIIKDLFN